MGIFKNICNEYNYDLMLNSIDKIKELSKSGRIVLYGAARIGWNTYSKLKENGIPVSVICDDNPLMNNKKFDNVDIIPLKELKKFNWLDANIFICCMPIRSALQNMYRKCISEGFMNVFYIWNFSIFYDNKSELECYENEIDTLYELLEDQKSKTILQNSLKIRFSGNYDSGILLNTLDKNQYFATDIFHLSDSEVFLDGGTYPGEVIETFLKKTSYKFNKIYAFEPDDTSYTLLEQILTPLITFSEKKDDIHLCKLALYDKDETVKLNSGFEDSCYVDINGENTVHAITIDSFFHDKISKPTYIKFDIEGSEMNALRGSVETIRKNNPKLAISIYHKPEDLWKIPLYIKRLVPEYKLYIRNYQQDPLDIVFYATV